MISHLRVYIKKNSLRDRLQFERRTESNSGTESPTREPGVRGTLRVGMLSDLGLMDLPGLGLVSVVVPPARIVEPRGIMKQRITARSAASHNQ